MSFPSNVLLRVMSHSSLGALTGCILPGSVLLSCVPSGLCAPGLYAKGMCASGFYASRLCHRTLFIYLSWNVAFKVEIQHLVFWFPIGLLALVHLSLVSHSAQQQVQPGQIDHSAGQMWANEIIPLAYGCMVSLHCSTWVSVIPWNSSYLTTSEAMGSRWILGSVCCRPHK